MQSVDFVLRIYLKNMYALFSLIKFWMRFLFQGHSYLSVVVILLAFLQSINEAFELETESASTKKVKS